jgi:tRNA U34 5-carboxymethylaminomethyl modifying GTPase MnmE/TrmE
VGKTSLLNALFGLALPVGMGHTTTGAAPVVKDAANKLVVWDTAGNNQDFNYLDPEQLSLFHSADLVFVLYDNSLLACDKIVRTVAQIKGSRCVLLRTKCDMWEAGHTNTIDQEIAKDRADLVQWGIGTSTNIEIYKTSKRGGFDNATVRALLLPTIMCVCVCVWSRTCEALTPRHVWP